MLTPVMAEPVQLDKAAAMVGKSEVTLRRLVKAGKIPFEKEKTLTGFIYRVDPDKVKDFYRGREGVVSDMISEEESVTIAHTAPEPAAASQQGQAVRIAVAGESGQAHEYWQKKSDRYEERFNSEVAKHAQTREELGVWRGRAEQSQSMLMKLLPPSQEIEVRTHGVSAPTEAAPRRAESGFSTASIIVITVLSVLVTLVAGAAVYIKFYMN